MQKEQLKATVESLIFSAVEPLPLNKICDYLEGESRDEIKAALAELLQDGQREERGIQLLEVAGGYQFRTKPACAPWVQKMHETKGKMFGRAALETLAIVAYRQPVTRAEIEAVRGVESGWVLRSLLEKELLRILGHKEEPGNPIIYGTSKKFLECFSLKSLGDLPPLKQVSEVASEGAAQMEQLAPPAETAAAVIDALATSGPPPSDAELNAEFGETTEPAIETTAAARCETEAAAESAAAQSEDEKNV